MESRRRLRIYNPELITMYEIEELITEGYRFDIRDGLEEEDYDDLEEIGNDGEDAIC